jgi:hypothetical protein
MLLEKEEDLNTFAVFIGTLYASNRLKEWFLSL